MGSHQLFKKRKHGPKGEPATHFRVIDIDLFEPTARAYPCYDYEEVLKKLGIAGDDDAIQSFDPEKEKIEKLVEQLNAKYGNSSKSSGKRRKFVVEDIVDKGMGYDKADDFIDDTEAYDEWVPSMMETEKGGHYVNKGPLEYRQIGFDDSISGTSSSRINDDECK